MLAARGQAEQYARALPLSEGWPPFLVVVDVGFSIELYADFSRSGKTYIPFPDPRSHRILLKELEKPEVRQQLHTLWLDPLALDPSRRSARVTRAVADRLAVLARSLEASGHAAEAVAQFLMRCIFTMFAEDVKLIPPGGFTRLLKELQSQREVHLFPDMVRHVWDAMNVGSFSPILKAKLLQFNGGLFENVEALPITEEQLDLLILAGEAEWRDVEPAIFGTLLERALDPVERHKLGAHYTPRAYVERLVMPTVIEPLREEWSAVQAAALTAQREGNTPGAAEIIKKFHRDLCHVRVLDPACGSGNFLYVTLEHLKRLEGEVLNALDGLGQLSLDYDVSGLAVDPHQLLGIEINPRAAAITDLVLWIGYLQWHFRTRGDALPQEPVIRKFHNIECRDAVLAYDGTEPLLDGDGNPVTRWDGRTFKKHPVTGQDVPDETARVQVLRYVNPHRPIWPSTDFVVGNPPFVGTRRMRGALGDDYVEALRSVYPEVPETCDLVMYWWHMAAELIKTNHIQRFGLITTNSIVQSYSRALVEAHVNPSGGLALIFAIADHPWVDSPDGAAVRVAMTVGAPKIDSANCAKLGKVVSELAYPDGVEIVYQTVGAINAALRSDFDIANLSALEANSRMCFQGVVPAGDGFKLSISDLVRLGFDSSNLPVVLRPYIIGNDLVRRPVIKFIIDLFGLDETEARKAYPSLYQHLVETVFDDRMQNNRATYKRLWWIFAEPRPALRAALAGLARFIVTPYTAKHRPFMFVAGNTLPDAMAYAIPSSDAYLLGVLSSRLHGTWAGVAGGTLEDRRRYNSKLTFFRFPFPTCSEESKSHIRETAEELDRHRKHQTEIYPMLTVTEMYNVLEKLRDGDSLDEKEKRIHGQGLVSVLKQIHDDLDAAVFAAYGWPVTLTDEEILERLVALNAERAAEERRGLVRWLRPEFQNPQGASQTALDTGEGTEAVAAVGPVQKTAWPAGMPEQAKAVRSALAAAGGVVTAEQLAKAFKGARRDRVEMLLSTLVSLGQAREVAEGQYAA